MPPTGPSSCRCTSRTSSTSSTCTTSGGTSSRTRAASSRRCRSSSRCTSTSRSATATDRCCGAAASSASTPRRGAVTSAFRTSHRRTSSCASASSSRTCSMSTCSSRRASSCWSATSTGASRATSIRFEDYGRVPQRARAPEAGARTAPRNRIAFFGQLNYYKGVDVLLNAMTLLDAARRGGAPVAARRQPRSSAARVPAGVRGPPRCDDQGLEQRHDARAATSREELAPPDGRRRLGRGSVALVGELAARDPGGVPPRTARDLQRHRRNGREGAATASTACTSTSANATEPRRHARARDHHTRALGRAARRRARRVQHGRPRGEPHAISTPTCSSDRTRGAAPRCSRSERHRRSAAAWLANDVLLLAGQRSDETAGARSRARPRSPTEDVDVVTRALELRTAATTDRRVLL